MATMNNHTNNTPVTAAPPMKQPVPTPKTIDSQSVLKRLQSELMDLLISSESGISAFPDEDNIFFWKGTISGSKDTVFEGTEYKLSLTFPNDYPFKPPTVKFETGCFHPNVDVFGNICLDILQDKWSAAYDVRSILISIQSLLGEPNTSSPLNTQAAALWSNQEEYRKMVKKLYKPIHLPANTFRAVVNPPEGDDPRWSSGGVVRQVMVVGGVRVWWHYHPRRQLLRVAALRMCVRPSCRRRDER
ncbi:hypothetical protein E3N88_11859 [Mikania micrantha]|uniref:E2 ubiquitin-conjugating enzyme n=1 Tax=Mikania micrantha TaxID=192012 RepID=A0A5N6P3V8_9ASTR|nr:hypothetical protein E3N88_11859 [Mikania micrantha]